jgi:hypothetical protein
MGSGTGHFGTFFFILHIVLDVLLLLPGFGVRHVFWEYVLGDRFLFLSASRLLHAWNTTDI